MSYPPIGPEHGGADLDAAIFREAESELETKAQRYAQLHDSDPPRANPLRAIWRTLRRRGERSAQRPR